MISNIVDGSQDLSDIARAVAQFFNNLFGIFGLIYGLVTGILQALMSVRLCHSWRLILAAPIGFTLGGLLLGVLVRWLNPTEPFDVSEPSKRSKRGVARVNYAELEEESQPPAPPLPAHHRRQAGGSSVKEFLKEKIGTSLPQN